MLHSIDRKDPIRRHEARSVRSVSWNEGSEGPQAVAQGIDPAEHRNHTRRSARRGKINIPNFCCGVR